MVETSPLPIPTPLAMSSPPSTTTPSPIPIRPASAKPISNPSSPTITRPVQKPLKRSPKLLLQINDLSTRGSHEFLSSVNASKALPSALATVLSHLYPSTSDSPVPGTRSVTLVLRTMDGVAYTTCKEIDDDHKEIHLSTSYIENIPAKRKEDEIMGVITHEMVHCWQWSALGTAPGGLIEGVADWVRLKAGLAPPHWTKKQGGDWDAGYQHTGYFLEHLENKFGEGSVRRVNDSLRKTKYNEDKFWKAIFGRSVGGLWEDYQKRLEKQLEVEEEPVIVERHSGEEPPTSDEERRKSEVKVPEERAPPSYLV